jgi:hypothetical protein
MFIPYVQQRDNHAIAAVEHTTHYTPHQMSQVRIGAYRVSAPFFCLAHYCRLLKRAAAKEKREAETLAYLWCFTFAD